MLTERTSFEFDRMSTTQAAVTGLAKPPTGEPGVLLSSHLEAKLAAWALMLQRRGLRVGIAPSNPATISPSDAQEVEEAGVTVLRRQDPESFPDDLWRKIVEFRPTIVFDDGALLINHCANHAGDLPELRGAVEFTTTGHNLLGKRPIDSLPWPVFDVGLSYCKYDLGNVYGTGLSTLVALSYATNVNPAAKTFLVIGYGAVGRGMAEAARRFGARVIVVDNRVRRRARAHLDGYETSSLKIALPSTDIVVTCTGSSGALSSTDLQRLPDQAIVANVGCFSSEIDLAGLRAIAERVIERDRQIETFCLRDGRCLHVLAKAELVNLAIGRGWPIELIDLCFALSTLCFDLILRGDQSPGLLPVPSTVEDSLLELFLSSVARGKVR